MTWKPTRWLLNGTRIRACVEGRDSDFKYSVFVRACQDYVLIAVGTTSTFELAQGKAETVIRELAAEIELILRQPRLSEYAVLDREEPPNDA